MTDSIDLEQIRQEAIRAFIPLRGVTGIALGDGTLRVYVDTAQAARQLPLSFCGLRVEAIITGPIRPQ